MPLHYINENRKSGMTLFISYINSQSRLKMTYINCKTKENCPTECKNYDNKGNGNYIQYCYCLNGNFQIENGILIKCPIGLW